MAFTVEVNQEGLYPSIILKDSSTDCFAEVYAKGALLNAFCIPLKEYSINIIDGFDNKEDATTHITDGFKSCKLSPFVCRMKEGKYTFQEKAYQVDKFYLATHAIHGLIFDLVYTIASTEVSSSFAQVTLTAKYSGFDKGYPFPFSIAILWKLEKNNTLSVTTKVEHQHEHPIPYADGWHPYFTLGETIDTCILQFSSNKQLEFDATLIPTGKVFDDHRFEQGALLKDVFLDNCFQLSNPASSICILKNDTLQLTILPDATYPFLQVYTPPHRKSIAIENLSAAPDALNNKMGLVLLEPNKPYSFTTTYSVQNLK